MPQNFLLSLYHDTKLKPSEKNISTHIWLKSQILPWSKSKVQAFFVFLHASLHKRKPGDVAKSCTRKCVLRRTNPLYGVLHVIILVSAMLVSFSQGYWRKLQIVPLLFIKFIPMLPNYNRATVTLAHTLSWNFKSFHEINRKCNLCKQFFHIFPYHTVQKRNQELLQNCARVSDRVVQTLYRQIFLQTIYQTSNYIMKSFTPVTSSNKF